MQNNCIAIVIGLMLLSVGIMAKPAPDKHHDEMQSEDAAAKRFYSWHNPDKRFYSWHQPDKKFYSWHSTEQKRGGGYKFRPIISYGKRSGSNEADWGHGYYIAPIKILMLL